MSRPEIVKPDQLLMDAMAEAERIQEILVIIKLQDKGIEVHNAAADGTALHHSTVYGLLKFTEKMVDESFFETR